MFEKGTQFTDFVEKHHCGTRRKGLISITWFKQHGIKFDMHTTSLSERERERKRVL